MAPPFSALRVSFPSIGLTPYCPEAEVWWKHHGRPDDPSSHSDFDGYCETIWHKQKFSLSKVEFVVWAQTDEGKAQIAHWTQYMVSMKKQGVKRFTDKMWDACPAPLAFCKSVLNH